MIPEDVIQKIKDENDIVDVISEKVKLRKAGRNYIGLCPFHHEKTPSFSVSAEKQIFKCFGCGEAGNVLSFVMKTRNISYVESIKVLAERANIDIEVYNNKNNTSGKVNEKLYKLNVEAARYFFSNLNKNISAKTYFTGRGLSETTIRRFGLGYAADDWRGLFTYLKNKGYTELDLVSAGLIINGKNNSYYDRFRNRVMFPVFDYKGKVIGFGGRVLDDSKPKYLNSPETPIFKKGTNLYGLNFALKTDIKRMFIIVEGYMDCISLHQYGITNVVASLGTALTIEQAKLLKRYADKIVISYDADFAGQTATARGLKILRDVGFDVRVLKVPQGKDPDEYIRSNGREAFEKLIEDAMPFIDYRIKSAAEGIDFKNEDMVIKYVRNIADILKELDAVEKDVYIRKVSEETGIKEQAIYDLLSGELQRNTETLHNMNNVGDIGQKLYLEPAYLKAERRLLKLMLKDNDLYLYICNNISIDDFNLDSHKRLYLLINETTDLPIDERVKSIEMKCSDADSLSEWINIMEDSFEEENCDLSKLIDDYIKNVKKFRLEESKKEVMSKIKQLEKDGLVEESLNMVKMLKEIQGKINQL
ncbi:MAG: DNA primase [Bacillota bacterium]|nr:DNA primase [Bacillota bacterium]